VGVALLRHDIGRVNLLDLLASGSTASSRRTSSARSRTPARELAWLSSRSMPLITCSICWRVTSWNCTLASVSMNMVPSLPLLAVIVSRMVRSRAVRLS
jgi:hypothetical protein